MELETLLEEQADLKQVIQHDLALQAQCWQNFDDEGDAMLQVCISNNKSRLNKIDLIIEFFQNVLDEQQRSPDEEDPNRGNKS